MNVRTMANSLGIVVEEVKNQDVGDFNEWLHVAAFADGKKTSAGGTLIGARSEPRIVRVHSRPVEIVPNGVLFFMTNKDRPGIVGYIGTLMGKYKVNIASMSLSRNEAGGEALTVLNLDGVPPQELLDEVAKDKDISNVKVVTL